VRRHPGCDGNRYTRQASRHRRETCAGCGTASAPRQGSWLGTRPGAVGPVPRGRAQGRKSSIVERLPGSCSIAASGRIGSNPASSTSSPQPRRSPSPFIPWEFAQRDPIVDVRTPVRHLVPGDGGRGRDPVQLNPAHAAADADDLPIYCGAARPGADAGRRRHAAADAARRSAQQSDATENIGSHWR
jgi:hypothetical protein